MSSYDYPAPRTEWTVTQRIFSVGLVDETFAYISRAIGALKVPGVRQHAGLVIDAYDRVEDDMRYLIGGHLLPYASMRRLPIPPSSLYELWSFGDETFRIVLDTDSSDGSGTHRHTITLVE